MHLKSLLISLHIGVMGFPVITDNCEKQTEHIIFPKKFFNYIFRAHGYITVRIYGKLFPSLRLFLRPKCTAGWRYVMWPVTELKHRIKNQTCTKKLISILNAKVKKNLINMMPRMWKKNPIKANF